mmetsp:Transcript_26006/g.47163  ORF Transcript_26006/g.47163 Transcript_26006/m.47163 type:complete len:83 (-) Transcript_26006:272-520(-)
MFLVLTYCYTSVPVIGDKAKARYRPKRNQLDKNHSNPPFAFTFTFAFFGFFRFFAGSFGGSNPFKNALIFARLLRVLTTVRL